MILNQYQQCNAFIIAAKFTIYVCTHWENVPFALALIILWIVNTKLYFHTERAINVNNFIS